MLPCWGRGFQQVSMLGSDALRVAIERGVEVLERELGIALTGPAPKRGKAARKPAKK